MRVDWGGSMQVKLKNSSSADPRSQLWTDVVCPSKSHRDLMEGNKDAVQDIRDWFVSKKTGCLFVHGPSGVGKTISIRILSEECGFKTVHTFADVQRTPQKLDSLLSEVSMVDKGVLVLDDFEAFLRETSSIKYLSKMIRGSSNSTRLIMVCNAVDNTFLSVSRVSTCVEFKPLDTGNISRIISTVSSKTRGVCHIPPMDAYFMASNASGNACQVVNQIQFMYAWTKPPKPVGKRKRPTRAPDHQNKLQKIDPKSKKDGSNKMFFTVYRSSSVEGFLKDDRLLESMENMNRDFLEMLGKNLHVEIPKYFHDEKSESLCLISECMENLSLSDSYRPEVYEDGMYDTENSGKWVDDDMNFVVCVHESLCRLKTGRMSNKFKNATNPYKKRRNPKFVYEP